MFKKKLRDGIIIAVSAIVICLTVVFYSIFTSNQIFTESAVHLSEMYGQVNSTFYQMVSDNRKLISSWEQYIVNATADETRWEEFKTFIAEQKEQCVFTDFYLLDTDSIDNDYSALGKRSYGEIETLQFRQEIEALIGGKDVGVVATSTNAAGESKQFLIFAVPLTIDNAQYEGFSYNAIAVVFDSEDMQKALTVNAFRDEGVCYVLLPDGSILLQSRNDNIERTNYLDFLRNSCTITGTDVDSIAAKWNSENPADRSDTVLVRNKSDNKEYYMTYMPVEYNDWILLGTVPSEVVNSNMSRFRIVTIVVMIAIFVCILAVIIWMLITVSRQRAKENEQKVKSREQLLDLLTQDTNDIFLLFTSDDFAAQYASANIEQVLGLKMADIRQDVRNILAAAVSPARPFTAEKLSALDSVGTWETELQLQNANTQEIYWYKMALKHSEYNGKAGYVIMLSDRTRERKMSADLESALSIAKSANKAKSNFLSNMSHDIRTPMNAIIGFATLLAKDADNPEKVREYIRKIMFSSQHLLSLINDILDMSKIESGKTSLHVEEFNLASFLDELCSIMIPQAKAKKQTLEVRTKGKLPEQVFGDKLRINQILLNLLSNAVKYTPEGGAIQVTVDATEKRARHNHVHLKFLVKDNGIGMSADFVKVIFEPFSREATKATKEIQGTGLGMTITKNIVDLMGGTISVESAPGKGSTFTVELELAVPEAIDGDDETFWSEHDITEVLVVDDEEDVCLDVQELMRDTGVKVSYALNGMDAIKMVSDAYDGGKPFNVVLLDWKMPGMDGVETAKHIRAKVGADVPIMVLTSYSFDEIEEEAKAAGIDLFLSKPFFVSNFRNAVTRLKQEAPAEETESASETVSLKGLKILAAEDNEINAEILQELLDIEGVRCDIVGNGKEAAEKFAVCKPGQYDMIFMDIQMPVMNGYEAARAIRACEHPEAKTIPIIAMTANAFDDDVKAALDAGMNAHLAKPIDMDKLKAIIAQLRGGQNE